MIPEVRQDQRPESRTFRAVAVQIPPDSPLAAFGEWAVMTLDAGGAYVAAGQVADWTVLS